MDIIASKLNLVSREEFEIQKKRLEKLEKDISTLKNKKKFKSNKKSKKAK